MQILHYNFAQPSDNVSGAGGVGIYLNGLIHELKRRAADVIALSSGTSYSPYSSEVALQVKRKGRYDVANIINSPVIAPSHKNFFSPDLYLRDTRLDGIPRLLQRKFGDIDVFHFHNLEGLTINFFFRLRDAFPRSAIYFSAHNYNIVCPQVNLWKDDAASCTDYRDGKACVSCIQYRDSGYHKRVQASYWLKHDLARWPASVRSFLLRRKRLALQDWRHFEPGKAAILRKDLSEDFRAYRQENAAMARQVFDRVFAVSGRTKTVLIDHGLHAANVHVSYIGSTAVGEANAQRRTRVGEILRIAYFGYARRDKGFFFLMRALKALPENLARRIALTVAVRIQDKDPVTVMVGRLARTLHAVSLHNGYQARQLPLLLEGVSLGVIPSLWEDNLPQVAIEYVAAGVPILVSDLGGASEIGANQGFVFEAGSVASFTEALRRIADGDVPLADFWATPPNIRSLSTHVDELVGFYDEDLARRRMPQARAAHSPIG